MKIFIKIAWRNIVRNKFRSLITITAIGFGLAALIFIRAFVNGGDCQMVENYTNLISAHIQIHKQGFHRKMGLERSIKDIDKIESILSSAPGGLFFAKRVKDYTLVSSTEQSSGVLLFGIEPEKEKQVTKLHERIKTGNFLSEGDDDKIVLGKDLLDILNVELEDKVVIMAQAADGSLAAGAYRVCGVLDTGAEEIDKGAALITLAAAQELLCLGDKVSEFAVRANDVYEVDEVSRQLKEKIDTAIFEVLSWKEISPMVLQWLEFDKSFIDMILLIVMMVVAAGIFNTILMGVLERIREFGIMLALGTKRRQIVLMVGLESFLLGVMGVVSGSLLGIAVSYYFSFQGISLSAFTEAFESYYVGSTIYPRIFIGNIFVSSAIVLLTSIVISIYPAWKAAKLKPVEAIHHF